MKMFLDLQVDAPETQITYTDKILLIGSCFTEHMGNRLTDLKFPVLQNPNGILFDPTSVCYSLLSYMEGKKYQESDLFQLNELWQSWRHHSIFSGTDQQQVLDRLNKKQLAAQKFVAEADWVIITLGSSFSYRLKEEDKPVANCHRAPAQWFKKHLLEISEMKAMFNDCITKLMSFNPGLRLIFTVSPVRHIRDGVVENNHSKARLLETVHYLVNEFNHVYYFPAYELVIDVLRDYRFYDIDLVHPNYAATEFVFEKFTENFIDESSQVMIQEIRKFISAYRHKPFQPATTAHQNFLKGNLENIRAYQQKHPYLDFSREISYFSNELESG
jgi:hypothetical protein